MKRITICLFALLLTGMLQAQTYKLSFNPANGDKYNIAGVTDMKLVQSIMGQDMEIKVKTDMGMAYDIAAAGENKSLKMTYDKIKMTMEMMGQEIVMDSDTPNDKESKSLVALKGSSITAILKPNGEIIEIQGTEELAKKIGDISGQEKEAIKGFMSKDAIKSALEQSLRVYPDKPVAVGDTWAVTTLLESPYKLTSNNTYTLTKVEKNIGYLNVASKLTTNGAQPMQANGMEMTINLTGDSKGTLEIDINNGMPLTSSIDQNLKGKMEVMGQEVPISITTNSKTVTNKK